MIDPKIFDDLAKRLSAAIPNSLRNVQDELEQNFRNILQTAFAKLDLVTRQEFDVQTAVLAKTRAKLEELERQIAELEQRYVQSPTTQQSSTSNEPNNN